jgi:ATP-dependent helicase/nuclease subunit B
MTPLFPPQTQPRLFALPPGVDFPQAFADGLAARLSPLPSEARARVTILVNSGRMQRRVRDALAAQGPGLMPRVGLVTDPLTFAGAPDLPPAVPPLRRRLELAQLVERLLVADPDLAPRAAIYDLADSLARLFSEMQAEGVPVARVASLDVSGHSAHWARALRFVTLVDQVLRSDALDPEGRVRAQAEALIAAWAQNPPPGPVIIAGSTGSRGTTALMMQAVARLDQGAVVLPGFDFDLPAGVWGHLSDPLHSEDHPQFRYQRLTNALGLRPSDVRLWHDTPAPDGARNKLVSLALRPAPVTDQWMTEGQGLGDLGAAASRLSLIEAPTPRAEAMAIALCLREAVERGQRAALITPDRDLTRMVSAALDRWRLVPDDSGGRPLAQSAPGRFLRHVAALMAARPDGLALLGVLKHPLAHSGTERGPHLLATRNLELHMRGRAVAFPDGVGLRVWGAKAGCADWAEWLAGLLPDGQDTGPQPLADLVARHIALAEAFAAGPGGTAQELWAQAAGRAAHAAMSELLAEAPSGGALTPADYLPFVTAILQARQVRDPVSAHPDLMIWGTLEARVQGADLVILGGLNDGVWPKAPDPDPWLNRRMRADAGLLLPERQVGLSAHDFQQAICAPKVVLSRAARSADAPTVPSRWLNRLCNLLNGLPDQGGVAALKGMQARGQAWLEMAARFEALRDHLPVDPPAPRPAPAPPRAARPRQLSVTRIKTLIRDPYAIYARHVLGLRPLQPLRPTADALLRGTVLHKVLEDFTKSGARSLPELLAIAARVIGEQVPWPAARVMFQSRLTRVAPEFLRYHLAQPGQVAGIEAEGRMELLSPPFTLTAKADRIDLWPDGRAHVLDYKTGSPPSLAEQKSFDKQLLLQALMLSEGGFADLGPREVARITYLGLSGGLKRVETDLTPSDLEGLRTGLQELIGAYLDPNQGFSARRALQRENDVSDYDHLSRYGEWGLQDTPVTLPVGDHDGQ